ncbi:MAG TPA: helix-turn-helix domain-containing protein [Bacteroidales bacterium]|nr:helix-turn-helix domain-containing protein [Bacteroidales bacterium]
MNDYNNILLTPISVAELVEKIASEVTARLQKAEKIDPLPDRITLKEAKQITTLQESAIYKLTSTGKIPHAKIGKRLIFSRVELDAWMKERTVRKGSSEKQASDNLAKSARKKGNYAV